MNIKYLLTIIYLLTSSAIAGKTNFDDFAFDISQTVYKIQVDDGVSPSDVQISILSKASDLNLKFVSHQPLSRELQARDIDSRQVDIYQFCNPLDARKMIDFNIIFAAYMPCRIALVEDEDNILWLMMVDLDLLINNSTLSPEIKNMADRISNSLKTIIRFGKSGDF